MVDRTSRLKDMLRRSSLLGFASLLEQLAVRTAQNLADLTLGNSMRLGSCVKRFCVFESAPGLRARARAAQWSERLKNSHTGGAPSQR